MRVCCSERRAGDCAWGNRLTGAVVRSLGGVHDRLCIPVVQYEANLSKRVLTVDRFDGKHGAETWVEVRQGRHDGRPDEGTVVVVIGL